MKALIVRFAHDRSAATAVEYGLIAGLICLAIVLGATAIGTALNGIFQTVADTIG